MNYQVLLRSNSLNNIPLSKLNSIISSIIEKCEVCKLLPQSDVIETGACEKCRLTITVLSRYHAANIPVEYWFLKMEKDFHGYPGLFNKYNEITNNLKQIYVTGASTCFAGSYGLGKQLSLDTDLPTPDGFIKLSDLKEGGKLFDENGEICTVTKLHPINISPESYKITFDDGTTIDACADHQWLTYTQKDRNKGKSPTVKTTKEIIKTIKIKAGKTFVNNHSIPCTKPLKYLEKLLPIDPYVLGCWLGDGESSCGAIECADEQILENIRAAGYSVNLSRSSIRKSKSCRYRIGNLINFQGERKIGLLKKQLDELNLLNNKHIPEIYLHSSYEQRLALLQGLMDTDGSCGKEGSAEYTTIIPHLALQVSELIRSMGIKCNINKNEAWLYDKRCSDRYRINFTTQLPIFRLSRKFNNLRMKKAQMARTQHRYITNIRRIKSKPMRCITVDSPSHLFLITKSFIPTHNTMTSTCILKKACQKGYNCLYTTLSDVVNVLTNPDSEEKFLARKELTMVDFLVLDEFDNRFISSDSAADLYARILESIFRTRSQNKLPTIMCTNSPNILETFTGPLKQSLDSLMKGYMKVFPVLGEDFRKNGLI